MTCFFCGNPLGVDGEEIRSLDYDGTNYRFHPACDNDANIITDFFSVRAPRIVADDRSQIYRVSNGDSLRQRDQVRIYLEHSLSGETFVCDSCGDDFYGDGYCTEDGDGSVCGYCFENNTYRDGAGNRYLNADGVPTTSSAAITRAVIRDRSVPMFKGYATERFLAEPTVGIEFEHAPVRYGKREVYDNNLFDKITQDSGSYDRYECHGDGSIASFSGYTSREIVSRPASGDQLEKMIDDFYKPFADGVFSPGPEHPTCGFHMHVESRFVQKVREVDNNSIIPNAVKHASTEMLTRMATICREYVSSSRRKNSYCNTQPALRSKDMHLAGAKSLLSLFSDGSYPSIAVRTIGTIEFRLWPSSNSIRYTKARAELSQKLISYYDKCLLNENGEFDLDKEHADEFNALVELCTPAKRKLLVNALALLLGLSPETMEALAAMSEKFNPFSHQKTIFKFTERQLAALTDDPSEAGIDCFKAADMKIVSSGDTTADCTDKDGNSGLYMTFADGIKCYPATGEGAQHETVVSLAKGVL